MNYFDYASDYEIEFKWLEEAYLVENAEYFDKRLDDLEVSRPKELTLTQKKVLLYDRLIQKSHFLTMTHVDDMTDQPARCIVHDGILYILYGNEILRFKGDFIDARIGYFSKDEKYCSIFIKVADGTYKRSYFATCSLEDACMCAYLQKLYLEGNFCFGKELSQVRRMFLLD